MGNEKHGIDAIPYRKKQTKEGGRSPALEAVWSDNNSLDTAKAAIETGNDYNAVYNLTVNNISVNGFAKNPEVISTDSIIWANKNSMDQDHLNVVIDGVDVY